jgi:DNA-binding NtrC family response regulator
VLSNDTHILLVDDEAATRLAIYKMLADAGFQVREAADAQEALEILQTNRTAFDLMITDLMLPQMKGLDLAGEAQRLQPDLKVLYITGNDRTVMAASLQASHALLLKPFLKEEIVRVVRKLLEKE